MNFRQTILFLMASIHSAEAKPDKSCDVLSIVSTCSVVTPDMATEYEEARRQWASAVGTTEFSDSHLSPLAIIYANTQDDVLDTISFASRCGYAVSVRSGGHQYSGYSSCAQGSKCLQLDLSKIKTFQNHGDGKVTVGSGLKLQELQDAMTGIGIIPTGVCRSIGIGGHFQTSAMGFFARSFGSGMDHVESFRIAIPASGTTGNSEDEEEPSILDVNNVSYPVLYKAVLGGGPGSFGVVLDYTIQSIPDGVGAGLILIWPYTPDLLKKVGTVFQDVAAEEDGAMDFLQLLNISPTDSQRAAGIYDQHFIQLAMLWTGKNSGALSDPSNYGKYVQPYLDIGDVPGYPLTPVPLLNGLVPLPYSALWTVFTSDFDWQDKHYHVHSMMNNDFNYDDNFWEITASSLDSRIAAGIASSFQFQAYGGSGASGSAVEQNKGRNSYAYRDIKIHLDDWLFFDDDATFDSQARQILADYREDTKEYWRNGGQAVENTFMTTQTTGDNGLDKLWKDYYPDRISFKEITELKQEYDPCNIMRGEFTVPLKDQSNKHKCEDK